MKKKIYHGSTNIIEKPQYNKGKRANDFGRGFYCTENIELAKEWACGEGTDGYVNMYSLNLAGLKILDLTDEKYNILNWLAILTDHRTYWQKKSIAEREKNYLKENFLIDISGYDIIIGYRADDSFFSFAQDFVSNIISYRKLNKAMRLGKLGEQIVIKSEKAFNLLHFDGKEEADAKTYYAKKMARDQKARKDYRNIVHEADREDDLYMIDIVRGGIRNGDSRL